MCIVHFVYFFLDPLLIWSPHEYCQYHYGDGGWDIYKNVATTSESQQYENSEFDYNI